MLLKKLAVQNQLDFQCMKFRLTTKMAFWYPPLFPADFPHNVFIGHISINGGHDLAYLCVLQIEEQKKGKKHKNRYLNMQLCKESKDFDIKMILQTKQDWKGFQSWGPQKRSLEGQQSTKAFLRTVSVFNWKNVPRPNNGKQFLTSNFCLSFLLLNLFYFKLCKK